MWAMKKVDPASASSAACTSGVKRVAMYSFMAAGSSFPTKLPGNVSAAILAKSSLSRAVARRIWMSLTAEMLPCGGRFGGEAHLYNGAHCGRGSVVEHHLAKVRVASSNLVARSRKPPVTRGFFFSRQEQTKPPPFPGSFHRSTTVKPDDLWARHFPGTYRGFLFSRSKT